MGKRGLDFLIKIGDGYETGVIQDLSFTSKTKDVRGISIEYVGGATAGSEVVTVTGNAIQVEIEEGVTTAQEIKDAIEGDTDADALVEVELEGTGTEAQDAHALEYLQESYSTIAGLTANSLSLNKEQIDTTNKDSEEWRRLLAAGVRSMSVSGSGIYQGDANYIELRTRFFSNEHASYRLTNADGKYFQGLFEIASMEESGDHNGAHQFSVSLESADKIDYV